MLGLERPVGPGAPETGLEECHGGGFSLPDPRRLAAAGPGYPQGELLGLFQHFPQPVVSMLELELACSWGRIQAGAQKGKGQAVPGGWLDRATSCSPPSAGWGGRTALGPGEGL